jgi:hypothetical protein
MGVPAPPIGDLEFFPVMPTCATAPIDVLASSAADNAIARTARKFFTILNSPYFVEASATVAPSAPAAGAPDAAGTRAAPAANCVEAVPNYDHDYAAGYHPYWDYGWPYYGGIGFGGFVDSRFPRGFHDHDFHGGRHAGGFHDGGFHGGGGHGGGHGR